MGNISKFQNWPLSYKLKRASWNIVWTLFFRPTPKYMGKHWRNTILRFFGAEIDFGSLVHPTVKILEPWNLKIGKRVAIGEKVRLYNHTLISIEDDVVISQFSELCTSSHDISLSTMPLIFKSITVKRHAWITSGCFIHPGTVINEGAVLGARAVQVKDAESWSVYGGNPSKKIMERERFEI